MAPALTAAALGRLAFMQPFRPDELERLAGFASRVHWKPDEAVFREGERPGALYVVEDGRVAIELTVPGQRRVTVLTVGAGELFGWSSLFSDRAKSSSARAVADTSAFAFDIARLHALFEAHPALGYAFTRRVLQTVSERLRSTRLQLLDIFAHPDAAPHERKA